MTAFELHLAIEQKLQEQGSYKRDRIYPEAVDIALNEAMFSVLDDLTEVTFADRELKLHALQDITIYNYTSKLTSDTHTSYLPANFYSGINYRVNTVRDTVSCNGKPTVAIVPTNEYVVSIPFLTAITSPYYSRVEIVSSTKGVLYNQQFSDLVSLQQAYIVVANILDTVQGDVMTYWEVFKNTNKPNNLILVSNTPLGTVQFNVYKPNTNEFDVNSINVATNTPYSTYSSSLPNTAISKIAPLKVIEPDAYYKTELNSFTRTKIQEPHSTVLNNYLQVKEGENFILTDLYLDYIRKPKRISLALNQSCELAGESAQQRVINRAVEILKNDIQDPSVASNVQYNELRTRI